MNGKIFSCLAGVNVNVSQGNASNFFGWLYQFKFQRFERKPISFLKKIIFQFQATLTHSHMQNQVIKSDIPLRMAGVGFKELKSLAKFPSQ